MVYFYQDDVGQFKMTKLINNQTFLTVGNTSEI